MAKPEDFRSMLLDVLIADQQTRGHPVATDEQRHGLREALARLILDADALQDHRRWLKANDRARRHLTILPDERMDAVLEGGLEALRDDELAALALNPVALGDLADAVAELLPDAWVSRIEAAAAALFDRRGVRFRSVSAVGAGAVFPDLGPTASFAASHALPAFIGGFRDSNEGAAAAESDPIRLAFSEDEPGEESKRRLADHLFGDPTRPFTLELIALPRETPTADVRYELELAPAPIENDLEISLHFPDGSRRAFHIEVPPEVRHGEPPRSKTRSEPCDPIPADLPRIRGIVEPIGPDWPPILRLS